jgi:hypothetical protein
MVDAHFTDLGNFLSKQSFQSVMTFLLKKAVCTCVMMRDAHHHHVAAPIRVVGVCPLVDATYI